MTKTVWDKTIINDLTKVCNKEIELSEFLNMHWEKFKPTYINVFKYIESEGDVYLLVHKFFSKILRSDVQPLFQSDNQLFSYFKISAKNEKYDIEHKKEIKMIPFSEYFDPMIENNSDDPPEDKIPETGMLMEDIVQGESIVEQIFTEVSKILSEPYIQVLILLYKEYSPKEIRKMLGVSLTTVRDRINVIRKTLKEDLGISEKNLSLGEEKDNFIK